jgi:hypothetical protein
LEYEYSAALRLPFTHEILQQDLVINHKHTDCFGRTRLCGIHHQHLINKAVPFTLILDGTTDISNKHVVLVYFKVQEGSRTVTLLFTIMELGKSSTSDAYLEAIKKAVSNAGYEFEVYFKMNIVGIATNGENTMLLLHKLLDEWIQKKNYDGERIKLFSINCLAHKIQLVSRGSLQPGKRDQRSRKRNLS